MSLTKAEEKELKRLTKKLHADDCPSCKGKGGITGHEYPGHTFWQECRTCNGSGKRKKK